MDSEEIRRGNVQMRLLLIGSGELEFVHLRELLLRAGNGDLALDHVDSTEEALQRMLETNYDLLLCEYKPADGEAMRLLHDLRESGLQTPVIFLSDHIDQVTVAAAINAGAYDLVQTSTLDESSITRAIRYAIDMYCKDRQRQKAEDVVRKLSRAVEQSADLVIITDREGVIEYVNPAFEALTGYPRHELIGQNPRVFKSGKHPLEFYQKMWDTILGGRVFRGVMINRKRNGEHYFAEKTITPLRDADGSVTHFISNDRDITEKRNLESQLQQAQKMDAIGRLAGGVAHDFNNLLMVISAYSELTIEALPAGDPSRRRVQEILSASRRAADLTRQLLAFGRKQMQALQILDLNRALEEICRMLPRLIGEDIELRFNPASQLAKVKADPVQIEQVVMNLAANARDAMAHGGKLTIETANVQVDADYITGHPMVTPGDYVLIIIADSGAGIAPEHLANIFEPFYTTKEEGLGTGLGLATVYGIIKQSAGFIWVYSELGLGTTFKIYLPQVASAVNTIAQVPPVLLAPVTGTETLLLVEDEAAVRESTQEFLTMHGYHVLIAKNGEEALAIARGYPHPIHLMITDVIMPQIGGARLAEQMAVERPQTRVLFVSGYAENTLLRQGIFDVANRFLQKPFTLRSMAAKVREILSSGIATPAGTSL